MELMEIILSLLAAFLGTVSFAILFEAPKKHYVTCGLVGMAGWSVYLFIFENWQMPIFATFVSAFFLTCLSRECSSTFKVPATVYLICGIFCLVPGIGIYNLAYDFFNAGGENSAHIGGDVLKIAIAISLGISAAYELPQTLFPIHRHLTGQARIR